MSYKCPNCKYVDEIPNNAISRCVQKTITMLEPIMLLYAGIDCDDFAEDDNKPKYLDANHKIENIPIHRIEKLKPFPYTPTAQTSWIGELRNKAAKIMMQFADRMAYLYDNACATEIRKELDDIQTRMDGCLDYTRKRTMDMPQREFYIKIVNNLLCMFQYRALRLIVGDK